MPIFAWNVLLVFLIFLKRSLVFPILLFSAISLHWSLRKAFLSLLLFFGTLHSDGYIFPILCLLLLFFSQLCISQTTILPCCISFSGLMHLVVYYSYCVVSGSFCDPTKRSPPGSSVYGVFQGRIQEWVAIYFSRGSSPPSGRTHNSSLEGRFFTMSHQGSP